ncbi:MAG: hypothetical protein SGI90_12520 [Candidatus Eisenbacteria bacterium]|nr:hypothetical protein [Candidatus Eisenbacteria bacterium]
MRDVVSLLMIPEVAGPVSVGIFDVSGRRVRRYAFDQVAVEGTLLTWGRRDGAGRVMPSGRYFVRVEAGGRTQTEAVTLID